MSVVLLLLVLEIIASAVGYFTGYGAWERAQVRVEENPANAAVRHDPELGWSLIPGFSDDNYFGKGVALSVNSQGIRAETEYAREHAGRRIVVLGDSFAFGHGVGDQETFPARLEALSRCEVINLGMMGYGIDQAYLRYLKEESGFEHDTVVFVVITDDFRRMLNDREGAGYFKPRFAVDGGRLKLLNIPVPKPLPAGSLLYPEARLEYLRGHSRLLRLFAGTAKETDYSKIESPERSVALARLVFDDLRKGLEARHRKLIIVWFPGLYEFQNESAKQLYRYHWLSINEFARERGIMLLNMRDLLEKMPPAEIESLYLPEKWCHPNAKAYGLFAGEVWRNIRETSKSKDGKDPSHTLR